MTFRAIETLKDEVIGQPWGGGAKNSAAPRQEKRQKERKKIIVIIKYVYANAAALLEQRQAGICSGIIRRVRS